MKKVISLFKTGKKCLRQKYFPTEQDKSIKRWRADKGDCNLKYQHDLDEDSLVLDIGGFYGDFAAEIYARYSCSIKIFEPVPGFAKKMESRFYKNPKIEVFNIGLGGESRTETMYISMDSSTTNRSIGNNTITIPIVDITEWLRSNDIDTISLIKINIEGGEYELLEKLIASKYIHTCNEIQIQFHNFFPDARERMHKIQSSLSVTHQLTYQYPFIWENWKLKKQEK